MNAFFEIDGEWLYPRPHARSPWSAQMLHGRLLAGLAAAASEADHGEWDLQPTRLTVDLFKSVGMEPVSVQSKVVRSGRRIKVVDAEVRTSTALVARTTLVLLRRSDQDGNDLAPSTSTWDAPHVSELGPPRSSRDGSRPAADIWVLDGKQAIQAGWGDGWRRAWWRDHHALVEGQELTPFVRTALAADFASPLSHFSDAGLSFINADFSLHLSRDPVGELIGIEVSGRSSANGVAVGHCRLYDETGPVGICSTSAVANQWRSPTEQTPTTRLSAR